jgi:hypothetical protein
LALRHNGIKTRYYKFLHNAVDFGTDEYREVTLNIVADLIATKVVALGEDPTSRVGKEELSAAMLNFPLDKYYLLPFLVKEKLYKLHATEFSLAFWIA